MEKSAVRAAYFSSEEQTLILQKYDEYRNVIQAKSNTVAAAKSRKDSWQKIADCVNACNPSGVKRTWEQIKTKYKNIIQSANKKKNYKKKTGGGPPTQEYTPAEELALSNNEGRPLMDGVEGGVSSDPGGSGSCSQQVTFVQVDGETLVMLPPPPTCTLSHTEVEDDETVSVCSERALAEEGNLPMASTSRPRGSQVVGADNVRALYKRTLELEIEYKKYKIKKVKLEVEKLEYEKKERESRK